MLQVFFLIRSIAYSFVFLDLPWLLMCSMPLHKPNILMKLLSLTQFSSICVPEAGAQAEL